MTDSNELRYRVHAYHGAEQRDLGLHDDRRWAEQLCRQAVAEGADTANVASTRTGLVYRIDQHELADDLAPGQLVLMLIEFDDEGHSAGRSWPVDDPGMAAHLRHLATHLGEPITDATDAELGQVYQRVGDDG